MRVMYSGTVGCRAKASKLTILTTDPIREISKVTLSAGGLFAKKIKVTIWLAPLERGQTKSRKFHFRW